MSLLSSERGFFVPSLLRRENTPPEREIYARILHAYRQWNVREGGRIIDFDLTAGPEYHEEVARGFSQQMTPEDRLHMEKVLDDLIGKMVSTQPSSPEHKHYLEFLIARGEASSWFLKRLRNEVNGLPYIEKTNGGTHEETKDSYLGPKRDQLLELADSSEILVNSPDEYLRWGEKKRLSNEETKEHIRQAVRESLRKIERFTGQPVDLEYDIESVKENKYYYAWSRTNWETLEFVLQLNFYKTKIWTPGKAEELANHEVVEHLRRMNDWRSRIKSGKMPDVVGQTIVHGPESVVEEGLALTITHFVPEIYEGLSKEGKFQVDASILRYLVYGNVSLQLNGPNRPKIKDVIDYVHKYIPWEPDSDIRSQIKWRTQDATNQAYLPSYAFGAKLFLDIIDILNDRGRKQLIRDLSERPYTPGQLKRSVLEIGRDKRNVNSNSKKEISQPSAVACA